MISRLFVFGFLVLVIGAGGALGQSGRKPPKATPQPVVIPTPEVTSTPLPRPTPEFTTRVVFEATADVNFTFTMPEKMQAWAVDRLRDTTLLTVIDGGSANRKEAAVAAKADDKTYVVHLQLEDFPFSRNRPNNRPSAGETWINITIFSPRTGQQKLSRRVMLSEMQTRGRLPGSSNLCEQAVYGNDLLLMRASIEAAEIVMNSFNIPIPRGCSRSR